MWPQLLIKRWTYERLPSSGQDTEEPPVPSADTGSNESDDTSISRRVAEYLNPDELGLTCDHGFPWNSSAPAMDEVLLKTVPAEGFVSQMLAAAHPSPIKYSTMLRHYISKGFTTQTEKFLESEQTCFEPRVNDCREKWAKSETQSRSAGLEQIVTAIGRGPGGESGEH